MSTSSSPTSRDWLAQATQQLKSAGIATARLDALVLLEDCLNTNRAHILAYPETVLTGKQQAILQAQLVRREAHEPLAYIRGKTEFYGRDFVVNKYVLEPRPESETMINLLKQLSFKQRISVADIGSGSGALGITAALELPVKVDLSLHDIDPKTLMVAAQNAKLHNVAAQLIQSDLIKNNNTNYDILLCNLPYVPNDFRINTAAIHEPRVAIFGGPDGLDLYRELFSQLAKSHWKPSHIFTESLPPQHKELARIAEKNGYKLAMSEDFIQVFARLT